MDSATTHEHLQVGDTLPDLTLADQDGQPVRLLDLCEGEVLIAFFYPWNGSPGCVTQSCALRDNWPLLRASGVNVVGINSQSGESHASFRGKYGLPFPLLVDDDSTFAKAMGFMHALPVLSGTPTRIERSTVIADPGGTIRAVLRKVKPGAHFDMLRVELGFEPVATEPEPDAVPDADAAEPWNVRDEDGS